jgi:hypothetical protein
MVHSLLEPPLFGRLKEYDRILSAGAGGGFAFELQALVRRSLYLPLLEETETIFDVNARIRAFRHTVQPRARVPIPH